MQTIAPSIPFPVFNPLYPQGMLYPSGLFLVSVEKAETIKNEILLAESGGAQDEARK